MRKALSSLLLLFTFPALLHAGDEKTLPVESFDGTGPKLGTEWQTYLDEHNLGTKVNPFAIVKDGSPKGSKGHGHFSGHMGKNKDPWPWAVLDLGFGDDAPKDLSAYTHLRFYAKGDGKKYRVRLGREAVKDYCNYEYTFIAPKEWTRFTAPLAEFTQPKWGKQIPRGFKDVTMLGFLALAPGDDEDFDLRFTDVEFVTQTPAEKPKNDKPGSVKITAKVDGYTQGTEFNTKKYPFKYTGAATLDADQLKTLAKAGDVPDATAKALLAAVLWPGMDDKLDKAKLKSDGKKITGDAEVSHKYGKQGVHTLKFKVEGAVENARLTLRAVDPVVSGAWDWGGGSIKLQGKVEIHFEIGN